MFTNVINVIGMVTLMTLRTLLRILTEIEIEQYCHKPDSLHVTICNVQMILIRVVFNFIE